VSLPWLTEAVWDDRPPATAAEQVANGICKLRAELNRGGDAPRIGRSPAGYRLDLAGHQLDLEIFQGFVATAYQAVARHDLASGVMALHAAIEAWRGPALAGLDGTYLRAAADRLDELKVAAIEYLGWLELRRGKSGRGHRRRGRTGIPAPFPGTAGRAADAGALAIGPPLRRRLTAYRRLRAILATQLGIDPQPELADLHRAILRGEQPDITYRATPRRTRSRASVVGSVGLATT
jgi:DNA-binding SARP family transcriptional activator